MLEPRLIYDAQAPPRRQQAVSDCPGCPPTAVDAGVDGRRRIQGPIIADALDNGEKLLDNTVDHGLRYENADLETITAAAAQDWECS